MSKQLNNIDDVAKALLSGKIIVDNDGDTFMRNEHQEIVMNGSDDATFDCVTLPAIVVTKEMLIVNLLQKQ